MAEQQEVRRKCDEGEEEEGKEERTLKEEQAEEEEDNNESTCEDAWMCYTVLSSHISPNSFKRHKHFTAVVICGMSTAACFPETCNQATGGHLFYWKSSCVHQNKCCTTETDMLSSLLFGRSRL